MISFKQVKQFFADDVHVDGIFLMFVSAIVFFLETCFFHMALYITDYLRANMVIVNVLFGLAVGAFISYFLKTVSRQIIVVLLSLLAVSIFSAAVNIVLFPSLFFFTPALWIPFSIAGIIVIQFFRLHDSGVMYFFDLLGAVGGILLSVSLIPLIRAENCVLIAGVLLSLWGIIYVYFFSMKGDKLLLVITGILFVCMNWLFVYNLRTDVFNIAQVAKCTKHSDRKKIFCWGKKPELEYSKDSLIQRIDITSGGVKRKNVAFDAFSNDSIYSNKTRKYRNDPRIIHNILEDPDVLVIGAGAEGIIKPLKNETSPEKIDAIEINPVIINIMLEKYYELSQRAYSGINIIRNDANTFLNHTEKRYDLITLINTHMVKSIHYYGGPEYLHTKESIHKYFDHLKQGGHIMIEERENTDIAIKSFYRIVSTFYRVMQEQGIKDPEKNMVIYFYHFGKRMAYDNIRKIPSSKCYINAMFKNSPITDKDKKIIETWSKINKRITFMYMPDGEKNNPEILSLLDALKKDKKIFKIADLTPITDNRPFPFDLRGQIDLVSGVFWKCAYLLGAIFVLLFIFAITRKCVVKKIPGIIYILYFSFLGGAYLLIEIFFMQYYHKFMGGPNFSLIFIMGALLFSSGIGAYFVKRLGNKRVSLMIYVIPLVLCYHFYINKYILSFFLSTPLINSILVGISIIPLGFLMGLPFPYMLERSKEIFGERSVPLMFSFNLLAGSFGTILAILMSLVSGFQMTFIIGIVSYLVVAVFIALSNRLGTD